jgi:branched-subunit amino acid transport protein
MTTLLAVLVVGAGSLLFRLAPLLGAARMPDRLPRLAALAGMSVLAAVTVRGVLGHRDEAVSASTLVAAVAVATGLLLSARGKPLLLSLAAGAATYLVLGALAARLPLL